VGIRVELLNNPSKKGLIVTKAGPAKLKAKCLIERIVPDKGGYRKIISYLGDKDIFFIGLLFATESSFNSRRLNRKFEKTIYQKGRILYEQRIRTIHQQT